MIKEPNKKKINKKKKTKLVIKNPKRLLIFFLIIITILVVVKAIQNNKIEKKDYLSVIINNEDITSNLQNEVIFKETAQFFSFEDIKKCIDSTIYQEKDTIIMSSEKKVAAIKLNSDKLEINGSTVQLSDKAYKAENGTIYLPISELKSVYDIEFSYIEDYKNIVIDSLSKRKEKAYATKNILIKKEPKNSSVNIEKVDKGNAVICITNSSEVTENNWIKVKTLNGNIGYVKKDCLNNFVTEREEMKQEQKEYDSISLKKDISKKDISTYKKRIKIAEEFLEEAVLKKQNVIKVSYKNGKEKDDFERFKIEAKAILKECGITLVTED